MADDETASADASLVKLTVSEVPPTSAHVYEPVDIIDVEEPV